MDRRSRLQAIHSIRLIAFGPVRRDRDRIIVNPRSRQATRLENQLLHRRGKRKTDFLFHDQGQQIVGRMLFVEKLRSRLEQQRMAFDLGD